MSEVKIKCIKCDRWIEGAAYPIFGFFVCQDCSKDYRLDKYWEKINE